MAETLTIGVDATTWWNRRGFGRFTRLLLQAMIADARAHRFVLFVDQPPAPEMLDPRVRVVQVATAATVTAAAVADGSRSIRDMLAFRRAVRAERLDVMYFPAVYSWFPSGGRAPVVVTFHDAIAERFVPLVLPHRVGRWKWQAKMWLAKRAATRVTTVSDAARRDIVAHLGIPADRIDVILEAPDPQFSPERDAAVRAGVRARLGLPADRRLILFVGGLAPHKNLVGLIRGHAVALAEPGAADVDLALVGDPEGDGFHSNAAELRAEIERLGSVRGRVHFTGFVSDADLRALYSDALAVAMPAFAEGFGLPAAEAIACGTPVIATAGGAVAEVIGDAGLLFDPHRPEDIARAIGRIAGDRALEAELRARCTARAAGFSWATAAARTLDVLARVARG